jgi:hypothetical protein
MKLSAAKNTALKSVPLDHPINSKLSYDLVDVSPAVAEKWLGQNHGNRNLRPRKVESYARDMRNGNWMTSGDSIKFDWNGRLIDGQHRLEAVIDSGATIRVLVVKGLEPRVQDVLDVNAKRSASDALRFNGVEHNVSEIASMARIATARETGMMRDATSVRLPEMTNAEVLEWWDQHPEAAHAAALGRRLCKQIGCTPSALGYAIMRLEQIDAMAAFEFFTSMSEMRTSGQGDPRLALLRAFNRMRENGTRVTAAIQLRYIFAAWNAWRAGKNVSTFPRVTSDGSGGVKGVQIPEPR